MIMYEYYIKKSCVPNLWTIMKAITWREVENTSLNKRCQSLIQLGNLCAPLIRNVHIFLKIKLKQKSILETDYYIEVENVGTLNVDTILLKKRNDSKNPLSFLSHFSSMQVVFYISWEKSEFTLNYSVINAL